MTDAAIIWDNREGHGDLGFANGDLAYTTGIGDLENAVAVSLFTDARCPDDFTPWDGSRRGWWGNSYADIPLGSQLWLLDRAKKVGNTQLLLQARDATRNALQWLIDQGIAASVQVSTEWITPTAIGIIVVITQPLQQAGQTLRYMWAWK